MAVGLHSTKPRQLILPIKVAAERALYRRRHLAALSAAGVETEVAEVPLRCQRNFNLCGLGRLVLPSGLPRCTLGLPGGSTRT